MAKRKKQTTLAHAKREMFELRQQEPFATIIQLARAGCTREEILAFFPFDHDNRALRNVIDVLYHEAHLAGIAELKATAHAAAIKGHATLLTQAVLCRTGFSTNPPKAAMDNMKLRSMVETAASRAAQHRMAHMSDDEIKEEFLRLHEAVKKFKQTDRTIEREYTPRGLRDNMKTTNKLAAGKQAMRRRNPRKPPGRPAIPIPARVVAHLAEEGFTGVDIAGMSSPHPAAPIWQLVSPRASRKSGLA